MHPLPATGGLELSSPALRLLAMIHEHPGIHGPSGWAEAQGWDVRDTQDAYRELVRRTVALPLYGVRWRLGPRAQGHRGWAYRDVPEDDQVQRVVAMAWGDGWESIEDICRETGLPRTTVYEAVERAVAAGRCWKLGTCVAR